MSETVKTVFVNYIACALLGGLLEYAAPKNVRKTLRIAVVSVMLATSVSPLLKTDFSLPDIGNNTEAGENAVYDALMHTSNIAEKKIYNEMCDMLINLGIDEYEIYVKTTAEKEEYTVYLEEIKIQIPEEYSERIPQIQQSVAEEYKEVLVVEKLVDK